MKVLKLQVFNGNEMVEWKVFDNPEVPVKIGSLPSSHVQLADVSRMQAVIEPSDDGDTWRILDLGGSPPTYVSGEQIKNASLRTGDIIHFGKEGPWSMRVTIERATEVDLDRRVPRRGTRSDLRDLKARLERGEAPITTERRPPKGSPLRDLKARLSSGSKLSEVMADLEGASRGQRTVPYHHQKTFDGLCAKLLEIDDGDSMKRLIHQFGKTFDIYDDAEKAKKIHTLVNILRETRQSVRYRESVLLGALTSWISSLDSGASAYDMTEEEALDRTTCLFLKSWQHRESVKFLHELKETKGFKDDDAREFIFKGFDILEQHLAKQTANTIIELAMLLARIGGLPREVYEAKVEKAKHEMAKNLHQLKSEEWDELPEDMVAFFRQLQDEYGEETQPEAP